MARLISRLLRPALALPFALGLLVSSACGGSDGEPASGALCPDDSTLTYATFGQGFMEEYCTSCHSSASVGLGRAGAPDDVNFDTIAEIQAQADQIDIEAAAGPDSVNTAMPEGARVPTEAERRSLGEWLACGAP